MLAFVPQALCGEIVDSQCTIQVAHSSQWHPAERGTSFMRTWSKQGIKCVKDRG